MRELIVVCDRVMSFCESKSKDNERERERSDHPAIKNMLTELNTYQTFSFTKKTPECNHLTFSFISKC